MILPPLKNFKLYVYGQNTGNTYCRNFFTNMVLDHLLPSIQPLSFLEWPRTSFEQSVAKFYTILLQEYLLIALEMLEVEISSSLSSPILTRVVQWFSNLVTVLAREDVKIHIHALQIMTEQFQVCEWGHHRLGKLHHCSEMSGSWDAPDYPTCPCSPLQ
jgi:hypothetical protein